MENKKIDVAILGASGEVGQVLIELLEERLFPVGKLFLLGSERSAGDEKEFLGKQYTIINAEGFDFSQVQLALFSAGGSVSAKYAPIAVAAGCSVVDNTSYFRKMEQFPLIVPEVNGYLLDNASLPHLVANPNCSTIQMVVALAPVAKEYGLDEVHVATYQSVSGAGKAAVDELQSTTVARLSGQPTKHEVFERSIAFNTIPRIGSVGEDGYTEEETKMIYETKRLLDLPDLKVIPTCVRVPVFYGHSEAVHIRTKQPCSAAQFRELLADAPGILIMDDTGNHNYPTPADNAAGNDEVYIGRIRNFPDDDCGLSFWVVSDNIRKGAATNSIQIAELLFGLKPPSLSKQILSHYQGSDEIKQDLDN